MCFFFPTYSCQHYAVAHACKPSSWQEVDYGLTWHSSSGAGVCIHYAVGVIDLFKLALGILPGASARMLIFIPEKVCLIHCGSNNICSLG